MSTYTVSCRGTCRFDGGKVSGSVLVYIPCYENFDTKCDAYVSLCYDLSFLAFLLPVDLFLYIYTPGMLSEMNGWSGASRMTEVNIFTLNCWGLGLGISKHRNQRQPTSNISPIEDRAFFSSSFFKSFLQWCGSVTFWVRIRYRSGSGSRIRTSD